MILFCLLLFWQIANIFLISNSFSSNKKKSREEKGLLKSYFLIEKELRAIEELESCGLIERRGTSCWDGWTANVVIFIRGTFTSRNRPPLNVGAGGDSRPSRWPRAYCCVLPERLHDDGRCCWWCARECTTDMRPSSGRSSREFSFKHKQRDHLHIATIRMTITTVRIPMHRPMKSRVIGVEVESKACNESNSDTTKRRGRSQSVMIFRLENLLKLFWFRWEICQRKSIDELVLSR